MIAAFHGVAGGRRRIGQMIASIATANCAFPEQGDTSFNRSQMTSRWKHVATANASNLVWELWNPSAIAVTIKAAFEAPDGTITPILFSGSQTVSIAARGVAYSDALGVSVTKGDTFYSRTNISITSPTGNSSTDRFPLSHRFYNTSEGNGFVWDVDYSYSGAIPLVGGSQLGYAPTGVFGTTRQAPQLIIAGDSIEARTLYGMGIIAPAIDAAPNLMSHFNIAQSAARSFDFLGTSTSTLVQHRRALVQKYANDGTHAIYGAGGNDIQFNAQTFAQMRTNLKKIWAWFDNQGIPIYQCTLLPRTTSTDSWATEANQTVDATESIRVAVNNWLRTGAGGTASEIAAGGPPAPLAGIIDAADVFETSRNSGKWKPGTTSDGTHPKYANMADTASIVRAVTSTFTYPNGWQEPTYTQFYTGGTVTPDPSKWGMVYYGSGQLKTDGFNLKTSHIENIVTFYNSNNAAGTRDTTLNGTINMQGATSMTSFTLYDQTQITAVDLTGCAALTTVATNGTYVKSLNVTGCTSLTNINITFTRAGGFPAAALDSLFNQLDANGASNGTCTYISGNATPTAASATARSNLIARGWTLN